MTKGRRSQMNHSGLKGWRVLLCVVSLSSHAWPPHQQQLRVLQNAGQGKYMSDNGGRGGVASDKEVK